MLTSWCSREGRVFGRHIINVPKDFPTIHATVDAAPSGATIHTGPVHGAPGHVAFSAVARVTANTVTGAVRTLAGWGADPISRYRLFGVVIRDGDGAAGPPR